MFSPDLLAKFQLRDKKVIAKTFPKTSSHWALNRWLGSKNRYAVNSERVTKDFTAGKKINHKHLREYIAASTAVHCLDGWAYLSRAIDAQLCGDHDCARHLGYYAELRAAMSILAAHGIGVFNSEHAAVNSTGQCIRLGHTRKKPNKPSGPGTHSFVWDALTEWAKSDDATDSILHAVRAGGQPLGEWISHFAAGRALSGRLAARWLVAWGLDISRFADDRDSRNIASYRPTSFSSPRPSKVEATVGFVSRLWRACEPMGGSAFAQLDQEILRSSLREAYFSAYQGHPTQGALTFGDRIDGLLGKLQPTNLPGDGWKAFLMDEKAHELALPSIASKDDGVSSPEHSIQVAARSLLLLRIATHSASTLIAAAPLANRPHLDSIIGIFGEDRGFWPPGKMPNPLTDLWQDSEDAISALESDLVNIKSYFDLWHRQPHHASRLSACEKVGLWGMCG